MPEEVPPYQVVVDSMKNAPLKMIFLVHFVLTTWGMQGHWSPDSYFFYNIVYFMTLFWCLHSKDSEEPPLMAFVVNLIAILFDVIVLSVYFPRINYGSSERFSVGMAILNLVVRPISCLVLHKLWKDRQVGESGGLVGGQGGRQRGYHDIENQSQTFPPN